MKFLFLSFVALAVSWYAEAATYTRTESLSGQSFLDSFFWESIPDPANGRVDYVDQSTAEQNGLYSVAGNTVTLRADDKTVLNPSGPGRKSFRLKSNNQYEHHVMIFDIGHMPRGCGTWPALVGDDWPNQGEIDIIEGVNNETPNQSTLHTSPGCMMPSSRPMTGTSILNDCNAFANGNQGCGVHLADPNSFGHNFNKIGGGWYAVERGRTSISVFFWERGSPSVPSEVRNPGDTVDPSTWGEPAAFFPDWECKFSTHFQQLSLVINLDFCGDWAGSVYPSSGCPSTCVDYVNFNPHAFSNAYFEFNSLNIFHLD